MSEKPSKRQLACGALLALALGGCAEGGDAAKPAADAPVVEDPGPVHVHGLGVNPADGVLFIATHTGLFRGAAGRGRARRVAGRYQDTMGFTVTGPDRFLGSGHPDGREGLPPFLGLISSTDAGRSWRPRSLQGQADFHVLEAAGSRVYGFGSDWKTRRQQLLMSRDRGRAWTERRAPEPLSDLAIDPSDPRRAIAAGARALHVSEDDGRRWRRVPGRPGLLAWPSRNRLYSVSRGGRVQTRTGEGRWRPAGEVGGGPAAFTADEDRLYVALHDGTIKRSEDGGATWTVYSTP